MPKLLRKSIATVSLSGTLPEKLEAAAAAGFDGVEIFENDLLSYDGSPAEIRRICEGLGLAIDIYQPFRDFEAMPGAQRTRNLDRAERKFDVMQELGTDLVLVCSNTQPTVLDDDGRAASDLHEMAARAQARGLRVGYEALAWGTHVKRWSHAWRIVQQADHPALGLILDSFHTLSLDDDPAPIADLPGDRIFFVQLADAPRLAMDVLSWSRHFRNFPGQGALDVPGFLRHTLNSGYQGPISLEVFNDDFRAAPARLVARDGLRSLLLVEAQAQQTDLPATPQIQGVEFIEFAVDPLAAAELAEMLEALGFHPAGRHKSKAVDLWRQGDINLVLNHEQDSAAAEYFQLHGPSVCAMALRVDDVERTLARARALLCPEWQERVGPGERRIPALRAPDGTLIYLVQPEAGRPFWEDDFDLFPNSGGTAGLVSIDHIVQALPEGRMGTFVLFWRALFGLVPQQQLDTADPYGLVHSRALVSPSGTAPFRLALNASESQGTATGRFVSAFAGAGVHHIAFATGDIGATAGQIVANGAPLVPMPSNYYDDLQARWDLDDATRATTQQLGLLYDRDAAGAFWHAYAEPFQNRFFFEAVQRDGGYAGFGAPNAAIRSAAQARQQATTSLYY